MHDAEQSAQNSFLRRKVEKMQILLNFNGLLIEKTDEQFNNCYVNENFHINIIDVLLCT